MVLGDARILYDQSFQEWACLCVLTGVTPLHQFLEIRMVVLDGDFIDFNPDQVSFEGYPRFLRPDSVGIRENGWQLVWITNCRREEFQ